MQRQKLKVEKRTLLGKKVKKLRKEGILPANVYGKGIKSLSVQVKIEDFEKVYREAGETGLIDIQINGEVKPSLIHNVSINPLNEAYLHADFLQVNLKEKIKAMVPIVIKGEAKAVTDKLGLLLQPLSQVEVEALPEDLPEAIEINVEKLNSVNDQITISEIRTPEGATILTGHTQIVVKIGELVSKEAAEQAAAEAAAAQAAKTATAAEAAPVEEEQAPKAEETAPLRQGSEGQGKPAETKPEAKPTEAPKTEAPPKK